MDDLTFFEIGAALLVIWLATSPALWKLIDRQSRPGPIKNALAKDSLMLIHLALLIAGLAMVIQGLQIFH